MTLGFLFGSKNFCKLLCVSWEVFVLHGHGWIHWVAKSCTTTAHRWLFRDSQLSLRTLWSAVIRSPKFSARSTAPPLRLLHGAIVMLVLWQISQFRSLGKWVETLRLPNSSLLLNVGSEDTSWEELACESLRSGTLASTRFSLNSCSHSGMSEWHGSHRSWSWSSFLFVLGLLIGLVSLRVEANNGSHRYIISSTFGLDTGTGWESIPLGSSLSGVALPLDVVVGEEDELEEDVGRLLSCLEGVIEVEGWELEEELDDKPGTTIGTKFSVLHCIRIPF